LIDAIHKEAMPTRESSKSDYLDGLHGGLLALGALQPQHNLLGGLGLHRAAAAAAAAAARAQEAVSKPAAKPYSTSCAADNT
jgi:hypothetical protein